jgi:hypothetical protein
MLKTGLHLLRKVIRSFQKRKTKGSSKDILKIYFNKWRKNIEKMPQRFNTEIYSFDKGKEEIYNEHMKTEPIYNNNIKTNYNNINLVKKIKNFNKINLIENYNTYIELNLKKDSKNFLDSDEDFHDNKIITKTIGVPNSDRGSASSRKELKVNKSNNNNNNNKIKVSRNTSVNEFNLAHSYDIISQKTELNNTEYYLGCLMIELIQFDFYLYPYKNSTLAQTVFCKVINLTKRLKDEPLDILKKIFPKENFEFNSETVALIQKASFVIDELLHNLNSDYFINIYQKYSQPEMLGSSINYFLNM